MDNALCLKKKSLMPSKKPQNPFKKKQFKDYLKYSAMGFQMAATVILGLLIGVKLDEWLETSRPYATLISVLVFVFIALYIPLKEFLKK
ncbi:MAG: AtpZ/AtpI family protein [Chitinophagaceae bacterium]|nr:MAG: AtpZ/AtpI family protein [Chitinophagaceae bacterium]